jgi:hypothetical protein
LVIWLSGYLFIWLSGYLVIWLSGYLVIWLSGYLVNWPETKPKTVIHNGDMNPRLAPALAVFARVLPDPDWRVRWVSRPRRCGSNRRDGAALFWRHGDVLAVA